jgi:hypothetical protein
VDPSLLQYSAEAIASVAKAFLSSGADVTLLCEDVDIPTASRELWARLLEPVINLIRFYDSLPVVLLRDPGSMEPILQGTLKRDACLARRLGEPEPGLSVGDLYGVALPCSTFTEESSPLRRQGGPAPVFLTSEEDIPRQAELRHVAARLEDLRKGAAVRS